MTKYTISLVLRQKPRATLISFTEVSDIMVERDLRANIDSHRKEEASLATTVEIRRRPILDSFREVFDAH
jgi:hypothetical protein